MGTIPNLPDETLPFLGETEFYEKVCRHLTPLIGLESGDKNLGFILVPTFSSPPLLISLNVRNLSPALVRVSELPWLTADEF